MMYALCIASLQVQGRSQGLQMGYGCLVCQSVHRLANVNVHHGFTLGLNDEGQRM